MAFQTLHAEPLHPQKREAKVSQHHLKQRRPRKPNFPCARWIGPANPTFHVLGGSERASTDCSHPIVLCPWVTLMRFSWKLSTSMVFMFFCTNLCLLPFDAAGSKCLVQLGPSWQSQRTAKQDQQRNIYAQLRWTRHMLT